jgi:tRNA threonylcarbamoyladenosine biosynthesis protein TsaB
MLLLIADTSGKQGSVAMVRAEENTVEVIEEVPLSGGTFSAQLVSQIAGLLANHNFSKTDIGAFVAVAGPGSFTGLRVGLAAIKALAEILRKPIVPVSMLEVVALASHAEGKVLAVLDAGRGEVYAGEYEIQSDDVHGKDAHVLREELLPVDAFLSAALTLTIVTPDAALGAKVRDAGISVAGMDRPGAEMIACVGWRKLKRGETVSPEQLEANYIRRSDAEIFAKMS